MTKVCFLLAVVCGLASINVSLAEPSTMYGAAPAPKYPAPAPPPAAYPAPAPAPPKYEAPAPPKYEAPAPPKYEAPAPPKYEAPTTAKYEEKKEEYPKKMEEKPEYPPMKMEYGGKKYRRSTTEDEEEEQQQFDAYRTRPFRFNTNDVQAIRDAVIEKILSESDPRFIRNLAQEGAKAPGSSIGWNIRGGDPARRGIGKFLGNVGANLAGGVLGGLFGNDEACWRMGLSKKQAQSVRDAIMFGAENDPRFGKSFGKAFAQEGAGAVGSFIGSKLRGGDPAKGRGRGKFAGGLAGNLAGGVFGGLLGNDDDLTMEDFEDLMMDSIPNRGRYMF